MYTGIAATGSIYFSLAQPIPTSPAIITITTATVNFPILPNPNRMHFTRPPSDPNLTKKKLYS